MCIDTLIVDCIEWYCRHVDQYSDSLLWTNFLIHILLFGAEHIIFLL